MTTSLPTHITERPVMADLLQHYQVKDPLNKFELIAKIQTVAGGSATGGVISQIDSRSWEILYNNACQTSSLSPPVLSRGRGGDSCPIHSLRARRRCTTANRSSTTVNRNEQDMSQQERSIEMGWYISRHTTFDFLFISIVALHLNFTQFWHVS